MKKYIKPSFHIVTLRRSHPLLAGNSNSKVMRGNSITAPTFDMNNECDDAPNSDEYD